MGMGQVLLAAAIAVMAVRQLRQSFIILKLFTLIRTAISI
jgi:hypothetical protein